jgi:hypothetical protein
MVRSRRGLKNSNQTVEEEEDRLKAVPVDPPRTLITAIAAQPATRRTRSMDTTPSPEFCHACRVILGGDTSDLVIPAMRDPVLSQLLQQIYADLVEGRLPMPLLPLDPPAGTMRSADQDNEDSWDHRERGA